MYVSQLPKTIGHQSKLKPKIFTVQIVSLKYQWKSLKRQNLNMSEKIQRKLSY